ncbi:MAG TPA: prepilin peptidase [bacterium]|nr:prepilin peptidase [bacterium]
MMPWWFAATVVFVVGAVLGSFLNVVIYRLPRGESLVRPRSRCPHCGAAIAPRDNIPILSYILLRGTCRACRKPISPRYPLVEVTTAALLTALWLREGPTIHFVAAALFVLMLIAIFFVDLEHRIVPNAITYPGTLLGLLLSVPEGRVLDAVLTAAGAGAFFLLIALVSRGGMGGGDIKLAAMMGAFLGWPAIAFALLVAFTTGASIGLFLIATRRRTRKDPIPFGPSLAAGAIVAWFLAAPVIAWYVG